MDTSEPVVESTAAEAPVGTLSEITPCWGASTSPRTRLFAVLVRRRVTVRVSNGLSGIATKSVKGRPPSVAAMIDGCTSYSTGSVDAL